MISTFEASILGFVSNQASSRYEIMKAFQNVSIFWSGSPGSVYVAIDRLEKKNMLESLAEEKVKTFEVTPLGLTALHKFIIFPVPAAKLFIDPVSLKVKLRGLNRLPVEKQVHFCQAQLDEFRKAKELIKARRDHRGRKEISEELADLTLAQLGLEEAFIEKLLAEARS